MTSDRASIVDLANRLNLHRHGRARERANTIREQQEHELNTVQRELRKTDAAIEKYLLAFEAGTLSEAQVGPRIQALGAKMAEFRRTLSELKSRLLCALQAAEL